MWQLGKNLRKPSFWRSFRPEVFCKKGVLRNFAKFTGKYLCQSLFVNKVAGKRLATLLKRDSDTGVSLWILWATSSEPWAALVHRKPSPCLCKIASYFLSKTSPELRKPLCWEIFYLFQTSLTPQVMMIYFLSMISNRRETIVQRRLQFDSNIQNCLI